MDTIIHLDDFPITLSNGNTHNYHVEEKVEDTITSNIYLSCIWSGLYIDDTSLIKFR